MGEMSDSDYTPTAYLKRRKGPPWVFYWDADNYVHRTRYGTDYVVFIGGDDYKVVWIGREVDSGAWVTIEGEIGAEWLEFPNGGRYVFPKR